jgi:hypothetical protein
MSAFGPMSNPSCCAELVAIQSSLEAQGGQLSVLVTKPSASRSAVQSSPAWSRRQLQLLSTDTKQQSDSAQSPLAGAGSMSSCTQVHTPAAVPQDQSPAAAAPAAPPAAPSWLAAPSAPPCGVGARPARSLPSQELSAAVPSEASRATRGNRAVWLGRGVTRHLRSTRRGRPGWRRRPRSRTLRAALLEPAERPAVHSKRACLGPPRRPGAGGR